jgi:large conductance mechanosensitive channel
MGLFQEFREFAVRGNVVDLAVGIIIGAAFNGIIQALVNGVIMPPIGLLTGGVDFAELKWVLVPENPATEAVEEVAIQYGAFINTLVQFVIVAFAVFLLIKGVNTMRRRQAADPAPATPPAPTPTEALLTEIRDALRAQPRV